MVHTGQVAARETCSIVFSQILSPEGLILFSELRVKGMTDQRLQPPSFGSEGEALDYIKGMIDVALAIVDDLAIDPKVGARLSAVLDEIDATRI